MGESLTMRRRVRDEGFRTVNLFRWERSPALSLLSAGLTVPREEATANSVPAAAVIRGWRALLGFIGCKGQVGGHVSWR